MTSPGPICLSAPGACKLTLECEALRALAFEACLSADPGLVKRSLQAARASGRLTDKLSLQTGEEAARDILLNRQSPAGKGASWMPGLYALLALLAGLGFYFLAGNKAPSPESKAGQLPFEFQNQGVDAGLTGSAADAALAAEPALS